MYVHCTLSMKFLNFSNFSTFFSQLFFSSPRHFPQIFGRFSKESILSPLKKFKIFWLVCAVRCFQIPWIYFVTFSLKAKWTDLFLIRNFSPKRKSCNIKTYFWNHSAYGVFIAHMLESQRICWDHRAYAGIKAHMLRRKRIYLSHSAYAGITAHIFELRRICWNYSAYIGATAHMLELQCIWWNQSAYAGITAHMLMRKRIWLSHNACAEKNVEKISSIWN